MQGAISDLSSIVRPHTDGDTLAIYVVATTLTGTRAALDAARTLAAGFDPRITLARPAESCPIRNRWSIPPIQSRSRSSDFADLAEPLAMDVLVRVCLCRSH